MILRLQANETQVVRYWENIISCWTTFELLLTSYLIVSRINGLNRYHQFDKILIGSVRIVLRTPDRDMDVSLGYKTTTILTTYV